MEIMEGVHLHLLLLLVTLIQGIQGQAVTPLLATLAVGDDVSLNCTTATTLESFAFTWVHITSTDESVVVYTAGFKTPPRGEYDNFDLDEDTTAKRSTLIITNILTQDAGDYQCSVSQQADDDLASVTVEVGSVPEPIELTSNDDNSNPTYQATCVAIGSSPEETITWILDGVTQTDGIVETDPQISDDSLFDKRSVFTFPATTANDNVQLECIIGGHQVAKLNRQITRLVDIHDPPVSGGIVIGFTSSGEELTVTCNINNEVAPAVPAMSTFYIYSNGSLVTKPESERSVTVTEPEQNTEFRCEGSNYLGTTTTTETFEPGRTTTPPTALETTTKNEKTIGSGGRTGLPTTQPSMPPNTSETATPTPAGLSGGAYAGIAIGVIACIVIIVVIVLFLLKPECCPCFGGSGTPAPSNKPSGRAVGSSNGSGSEKDVESPLNGVKDVTAEEKLPQAAPRGHGSIQHTNDNPDQAMYAMVDKKPARGGGGGAGDAPDRGSGPGQNEPQGMLYADLDLSHKAGHTDKHVPKNENDVVVYSSILV